MILHGSSNMLWTWDISTHGQNLIYMMWRRSVDKPWLCYIIYVIYEVCTCNSASWLQDLKTSTAAVLWGYLWVAKANMPCVFCCAFPYCFTRLNQNVSSAYFHHKVDVLGVFICTLESEEELLWAHIPTTMLTEAWCAACVSLCVCRLPSVVSPRVQGKAAPAVHPLRPKHSRYFQDVWGETGRRAGVGKTRRRLTATVYGHTAEVDKTRRRLRASV